MAFAAGIGVGLMFKKYEKEISKYASNAYDMMMD